MDWNALKEKGSLLFSKYKFVLLVLFLGIALMSVPTGGIEEKAATEPQQPLPATTAEQLEQILSQIEGVGKVRVMLTESCGSLTEYQTDEDRTADGSIRVETVIVSGGSREEEGLIKTVTPATYLGAIIVCQGADRPSIQLSVIQAVSNVTGISSDRITVLKMK